MEPHYITLHFVTLPDPAHTHRMLYILITQQGLNFLRTFTGKHFRVSVFGKNQSIWVLKITEETKTKTSQTLR